MSHRYQGYCPDETQPDARDAECEACQSMDDLTMPELRAGIALQLREIECLRAQLAAAEARAERLAVLLARYRDETPIGHQPHMIAHQADAALGRAALAEGEAG